VRYHIGDGLAQRRVAGRATLTLKKPLSFIPGNRGWKCGWVRRRTRGRVSVTRFSSAGLSTINATFMAAVEADPDRVYLDFSGDKYTYARMAAEVERLARGLHSLGVRQGDRVVIFLGASPDSIIAWFATNLLGAIQVPINTAYKGDFLCHQVNDCGARIAICDQDRVGHLTALGAELATLEHILYLGPEPDRAAWRGNLAPVDAFRLASGEAPYVDVAPSDICAIIYTSGTTGMSKGCIASHNYLCDLPGRYAEANGRTREDIHWSPMPLFHIAGICVVVSTMQLQGTGSIWRKFSVSEFWPEIERAKATQVMFLGTMAHLIANAPDNSAMARCRGQIQILVASPMTAALAENLRARFGITWVTGFSYGSTECGLALDARYDLPLPQGSCGRVNDAFDVRVLDNDDQEVPPNTIGELAIRPKRPYVMFSGYWNNPEATMKASRNLWHHMGDQGRIDEDGNFFFADRTKDALRRRGENISSFEVEMSFLRHPEIAEVAITAVPSEVMEDDVKATIVLQPGAALREADILEWARPHVPRFALPRYIEFRSELPKTPTGRVQKFQLRREGVTAATWDSQKPS
jgi:crotonobetaine/carnitine-CoA ligase